MTNSDVQSDASDARFLVYGRTPKGLELYVMVSPVNSQIYPTHVIPPQRYTRDQAEKIMERVRKVAPATTEFQVVER